MITIDEIKLTNGSPFNVVTKLYRDDDRSILALGNGSLLVSTTKNTIQEELQEIQEVHASSELFGVIDSLIYERHPHRVFYLDQKNIINGSNVTFCLMYSNTRTVLGARFGTFDDVQDDIFDIDINPDGTVTTIGGNLFHKKRTYSSSEYIRKIFHPASDVYFGPRVIYTIK